MTEQDRHAKLDALMQQFAADVLTEMQHDCWITLKWWKGRGDGRPDEAYGPYDNIGDALKQAQMLRDTHAPTPTSAALWEGWPWEVAVVPVYREDTP